MKWVLVVWLFLIPFSIEKPKEYYRWQGKCSDFRVKLAYERLKKEDGCACAALYYFRCRKEPEYIKTLKEIRSRSWWRARLKGVER